MERRDPVRPVDEPQASALIAGFALLCLIVASAAAVAGAFAGLLTPVI